MLALSFHVALMSPRDESANQQVNHALISAAAVASSKASASWFNGPRPDTRTA
jgi:hypothetical protein